MREVFTIVLSGLTTLCICQQSITVTGFTIDLATEPIFGVEIQNEYGEILALSNQDGLFRFLLESDIKAILFSHEAYKSVSIELLSFEDTVLTVVLEPLYLPEVIVASTKSKGSRSNTHSVDKLKNVPMVLGEIDLLKSLTTTAGISQGAEGSSYIVVRGGDIDQNLILIDNVELLHRGHVFGFTSTYNQDILEGLTVYKNYFPPRYGGRLSSIVHAKSKRGSSTAKSKSLSIGLLNSGYAQNIPIRDSVSSLQVAARTSYTSLVLAPFVGKSTSSKEIVKPTLFFFEGSAIYNYTRNRQQIKALLLASKDIFGLHRKPTNVQTDFFSTMKTRGEVASFAIELEHIYNFESDLQLSNILYFNKFANSYLSDFSYGADKAIATIVSDKSFLSSLGIKNLTKRDWGRLSLEVGQQTDFYWFGLQKYEVRQRSEGEEAVTSTPYERPNSSIHMFFIEGSSNYKFGLLYGGFRTGIYRFQNENYPAVEPRIALDFGLRRDWSASYMVNHQFLHSVNSINQNMPLDFLLPSTDLYRPQKMEQFAIDWEKSDFLNHCSLSLGLFFRKYEQLTQIRPGIDFILNKEVSWTSFLTTNGRGESLGSELEFEHHTEDISFSMAYTFIRSSRRFPTVNRGISFPSNFERPHELKISFSQTLNRGWSFNSFFYLASGLALSLPTNIALDPLGDFVPIYTEKNNYRIRPYHRWDINVVKEKTTRKGKNARIVLGIYNLYGRKNPTDIVLANVVVKNGVVRPNYDANILFRFVPSINYQVSW